MDDYVGDKLRAWGLERFIDIFIENEVDKESFLQLDSNTTKELIVPVGPRVQFLGHLNLLKQEVEPRESGNQEQGSSGATRNSNQEPRAPRNQQAAVSGAANRSNREQEPGGATARYKGQEPAAKKPRGAFDIRGILEEVIDGQLLIAEMDKGLLTYQSRKRVVNTLVSHLIQLHGKNVKSNVKLAMAKAITYQFPELDNEDGDAYEAWFTPGQDNRDASGFFEIRLRNVRQRDKAKSAAPSNASTKPKTPSKLATSSLDLTIDDSEDASGKVEWLKHHKEPLDQVKRYMRETTKARAALIRSEKAKPVADLIKLYPRLLDTEGMIDQDFRQLFPINADQLFLKWPKYLPKIMEYVEQQTEWRQFLHFEGEIDTDAKRTNVALQALPLLFPAGCMKGKKGPKRATTDESCRSFIRREKIGTNLPSLLDQNTQGQPFILILGNPEQPEQAFVVVEKNVVSCKSLLQAVDVCFKVVYVLDINYAWQCQHTWDFIQKFFYRLGEGKGRETSIPTVKMFTNFLQKQNI